MYNLVGELVKSETQMSFSVEELPVGVYLVEIKTQKGKSTVRFIKE